ncbi:winged helix family transcriptional regulator [Dysgonomonas sp. 521]|uniref:winged helix-turn-helix domain-containing protein n=1 Tax=Dysgonomonas sp. 521 TaxID=2302932 RepID=UPI0013D53194|nr:winged helix-turn-helix domain-containing protein [Dysgonomonas sp. 521]NDV96028.1 winged helix family transcriptional regulator [Dysgonomonas sp. 521]
MEQLQFDAEKGTIAVNGEVKQLTKKESCLLNLLLENKNNVVERNTTLDTLWTSNNYFSSRSLDVYITKLRYLLKPFPYIIIESIRGKGHILRINELGKEA